MNTADFLGTTTAQEEDEDMDNHGEEEEESEPEGGAVNLMGDNTGDEDSSEEEDEGSDAEREVRKGFIVDEDDSARKKKKRSRRERNSDGSRKRRIDSGDEAGDLDDDDLRLLEENTGRSLGANRDEGPKVKRLRRRRSASAASNESAVDLDQIFDDDIGGDGFNQQDEMAGFIEDDEESDGSGSDAGARRRQAERRKEKQKAKKVSTGRGGFGAGMGENLSAEAWQEVTDVFGNGKDYEEAMEEEVEAADEKELKDIFEPSEIASRLLTTEDDAIRALDIPERMQLASVGLPAQELTEDDLPAPFIAEEDIIEATSWMSQRISTRCTDAFILSGDDDQLPKYNEEFILAVSNAITFINVNFLEVPYIWSHRADYFVTYPKKAKQEQDGGEVEEGEEPEGRITSEPVFLLNSEELWTINALSIKYRAFAHRKSELFNSYAALEVEDEYFDESFRGLESVEEVSDLGEWMAMKYSAKLREIKQLERENDFDNAPLRLKRASREDRYESAKNSIVSQFAQLMAVPASALAQDYEAGAKLHLLDDPELAPLELADQYCGDTIEYNKAEVVLSTAKMILVHELARDPLLKKQVRKYFERHAVVSVLPTDQGLGKVDEMNPIYAFKYLHNKPIVAFTNTYQYLEILSAENDNLVKSKIVLPTISEEKLIRDLTNLYNSDYSSTVAEAWNSARKEILAVAVTQHLIPDAVTWMKNKLKSDAEQFVGKGCARKLDLRINVAPWKRNDGTMDNGDIPSVLALSFGNGDPKRDSVIGVFLDSEGHLREHIKIDALIASEEDRDYNPANKEVLVEILRRRRPQVIVIGGFSASTKELMRNVREIADGVSRDILTNVDPDVYEDDEDLTEQDRLSRAYFDCIYVHDEVARIYQNSARSVTEFPELPRLGKYCVGLARYAQSPLNEYAALGEDLLALNYHPGQKYLSREKILHHLEETLIEVVNHVGVDINRAARDSYYYYLLPYVAGLGPRKASSLVKKINGPLGGSLTSRKTLTTDDILSYNVLTNAASFLIIRQDEIQADLNRLDNGQPDVLDDSRIHPANYEVARKMASDAMEMDEEDAAGHKVVSQAVIALREAGTQKLDDLSLDDFAEQLMVMLGIPQRLLLYTIREEMKDPYREERNPFTPPTIGEVFTMLTGETPLTMEAGLIVPVRVVRITKEDAIICKLDSGIEGTIASGFRADNDNEPARVAIGATLQAMVMELRPANFEVDLTIQPSILAGGDTAVRRIAVDKYYDMVAAASERDVQNAQKKKSSGRQLRVIKHPNFHNFNSGEAEAYLANQQRGDCVIRPSSKEDHLAITWKVDQDLYQHIAVHELNKPNEFAIGRTLRIAGRYTYSDLDELIVSHVKSMARKVDEMMSNEKYKGSEHLLNLYLQNFTMANPKKSAYAFALDRKARNAGQFIVGFRANGNSEIVTWPIKVVPGAFSLLNEDHGDVTSLCNAFKMAYQAQLAKVSSQMPAPQLSSRTPLHQFSSRTPNPSGMGYTPQTGMSSQGGRTPGRPTPSGMTPVGALSAALRADAASPYAPAKTPLYVPGMTPRHAGPSGTTPAYGGGSAYAPNQDPRSLGFGSTYRPNAGSGSIYRPNPSALGTNLDPRQNGSGSVYRPNLDPNQPLGSAPTTNLPGSTTPAWNSQGNGSTYRAN